MKKISNYLKSIILLIALSFFLSPSVFAGTPATDPADALFLDDVGELQIQMSNDDEQLLSIKQVEDIKKGGDAAQRTAASWNMIFNRYRGVIAGIAGVLTMTFVLIFLITFIKISSSSANPQKRAELSKSLIWVGLGAAGFGSITLIISLGFGLFQGS